MMDEEYIACCVVCGDPYDYCQGHGDIGDPNGARIQRLHDEDIHVECHPRGCEYAREQDVQSEDDRSNQADV